MRRRIGRVRWTLATGAALLALSCAPAQAGYDPSPPGANDFNCKPSATHPRPLVLVHGLAATMSADWSCHSPRIGAAGYCPVVFTYGVDPRTTWLRYSLGGVVAMERRS